MIGSVLGGRMFEHELVIPFNLLPFGVFLCNFARHHRPVSFRTCELPRAAKYTFMFLSSIICTSCYKQLKHKSLASVDIS
jgi:hypothetical protein